VNLANLITLLRIVIAPIYLWALYNFYEPGQMVGWLLLAGFIAVAATDGIDGAIARRQDKVTKLGKLLDPIADKILLGGAFVVLSMLDVAPWWATIAILVREVGMTVYRLIVVRDKVIPASSGGKSKTIMQCIAIGWLISPLDVLLFNTVFNVSYGLIYGAVFLTWWSAIQYIRDSR
jgi:CDP-diacylglycerol--glycerol-3-phosphate 3-phosphatidyltransferase